MTKTDDAWKEVGDHFTRLGEKFTEHYESQEGTEEIGPDIKDAFQGLAKAAERVAATISESARDEDVKAAAKAAANSFVGALGATFGEVGEEVKKVWKPTAPAESEELEDAQREIAEAAGDVIPDDTEGNEDEPTS
ncbi:MAG: hypothetical protein ACE5MI_01900 [Acidimicrobiia bacterium]